MGVQAIETINKALEIIDKTMEMRSKKRCNYCGKLIIGEGIKVRKGKWSKTMYFHKECFEKVKYEFGKRVRIEKWRD